MKINKEESLALKKLKHLSNEIKKHNYSYHTLDKPTITDAEYDKLVKENNLLEKKFPHLSLKFSPSNIVGGKIKNKFEKIKHLSQMYSLGNAFSKDDIEDFIKRTNKFLSNPESNYYKFLVEPKIDGLSLNLVYDKGKLISAATRGDGLEGENVIENIKKIRDIPFFLNKDFPSLIEIRGEVFINKDDFKVINSKLKDKDKFANPRNAASGSLRQKNPEETKKIPLKFIAYTFGYNDNNKSKTQSDFLSKLKSWGFKISEYNQNIKGIKNLTLHHKRFEEKRFSLDYDIDGLVYKVNEFELQKRLGFVANAPRWAIAHKFSANSSISKILNIEIQIGRTGALTPVAKIEPINIGGVLVANATLHNEDEIERKDIRVGDTVKIERAGDVIPHVVSVDKNKRTSNSKKYIFPVRCPSCKSKTIKEFNKLTKKHDAVRRCLNENFKCERIAIECLKHFVSKEALNIDGFGKKIVENFWELKFIKSPQDIFSLDYQKVEKLEGWGSLSVSNLKYSIEKAKKINLDRFIFALGIRHIGRENAKLLSQHLKNIKNFYKLSNIDTIKNLTNIDGIGETQIKSIESYFSNKVNITNLKKLIEYMNISDATYSEKDGILKNKTFMFTGKLKEISRAEAKSLVEKNSGKIISNVNKKLNYLIVGEKPTKKKVDNARKLKIKIIDQVEFLKMLNKTS